MNTNENNEAIQDDGQKKLEFLNFKRWFWNKDRTKIFLVISEGVVVPVHVNFLKARAGMSYTPVKPRAQAGTANEPRVA